LSTEGEGFDSLVRDLIARAHPGTEPAAGAFVPMRDTLQAPPVGATPVADRPAAISPTRAAGPRPVSARPILVTPAVAALGLQIRQPLGGPDVDRLSLLSLLDSVAVRPPQRLTGVQVVVGSVVAVRSLAIAWISTVGAPPSAVLRLTRDLRPVDVLKATVGDAGVIVTVPVPDPPEQVALAVTKLDGFGDATVTAVVDARSDVATRQAWLDALAAAGRPADALAGVGIHETADPLGLLEHGLPVTWLDDRPATIGTWAGPCLDRWQ
jgi:hypothetical protein